MYQMVSDPLHGGLPRSLYAPRVPYGQTRFRLCHQTEENLEEAFRLKMRRVGERRI